MEMVAIRVRGRTAHTFYSLDDSTIFIDGDSEWCVELANLIAGNPHTTEHNKQ